MNTKKKKAKKMTIWNKMKKWKYKMKKVEKKRKNQTKLYQNKINKKTLNLLLRFKLQTKNLKKL